MDQQSAWKRTEQIRLKQSRTEGHKGVSLPKERHNRSDLTCRFEGCTQNREQKGKKDTADQTSPVDLRGAPRIGAVEPPRAPHSRHSLSSLEEVHSLSERVYRLLWGELQLTRQSRAGGVVEWVEWVEWVGEWWNGEWGATRALGGCAARCAGATGREWLQTRGREGQHPPKALLLLLPTMTMMLVQMAVPCLGRVAGSS